MPGVSRRDGPSGQEQPYGRGQFDNGVSVTELVRRCYLKLDLTAAAAFGDPLVTAGRSFFAYLTTSVGTTLPPLLREIYDERPDVRAFFPDVTGHDRDAFLHWASTIGIRDHNIDPALLGVPSAAKARTTLGGGCATELFGINLMGYFQSEKGVGEHSRGTIRSLQGGGIPYVLNNYVDHGSSNVDATYTDFTTENPYPVNLIILNPEAVPVLASESPKYLKGRYNIGYWNWELEWFPTEWRGAFKYFDEIWALSTFTRNSIARVSPIPVHALPAAIVVPPRQAEAITRERLQLPPNAFLFLFAFDFHSHLARKNPLAVNEAFRRAFPTRRDVVLVLKTSRSKATPMEFSEVLLACRGQPNIRILREVLSRGEMYDLLRLCDAYVGLHRSEGFGLPLAEAMALAKPVIATDYSANVDFMNESNSYPVRYRMVAIEQDHGPYRKGAEWADPDVDHAAEQMRRVVEEPATARAVAARARADIARLYSPQAVGQQIRDRLTAILRRADARPVTTRFALSHGKACGLTVSQVNGDAVMLSTGERYLPEIDGAVISYEHWHRYLVATQFVTGKTVLDIAAGEGYGSALALPGTAAAVVGVDLDPEAVAHARVKYPQHNLTFQCGPAEVIPIPGCHIFDVIVFLRDDRTLDRRLPATLCR